MLRQFDCILKDRNIIRFAILKAHSSQSAEEQRKRAKVPLVLHIQNDTVYTRAD